MEPKLTEWIGGLIDFLDFLGQYESANRLRKMVIALRDKAHIIYPSDLDA